MCNGFWINNKDVYATNAWLAKQLKCSERMITEAVAKLEKIGVIVCARSRNSRIMKKGGDRNTLLPPPKRIAISDSNALLHNSDSNSDIKSTFSKENVSSKKFTEERVNNEGEALGTLPIEPRKYNPVIFRLIKHFRERCEKEYGFAPTPGGDATMALKRALKRLSEGECYEKIDEWFQRPMPDQHVLSLRRCFTDNEINGFKVGYAK